jgi:hypothetical protein
MLIKPFYNKTFKKKIDAIFYCIKKRALISSLNRRISPHLNRRISPNKIGVSARFALLK